MSENEILAAEQVAENVEQTTEETPVKTYTQEEVDAIVGKAKARARAKIEKDYQRKYGSLEEVLKAGTGKESVEEMTDTFAEFYRKKGINIPEEPTYSAKDIDILARAEAQEFIDAGFDDVVEEVERLTAVGAANMTAKEKAMFKVLAEHRQSAERGRELNKIGVTEDVYNSQEFRDFAGKFNPTTPIRDIYDIYAKTQPKKEIKTMGSMTNHNSGDNGVKDFYTRDEALKFTKADFDKNPALFAAVEKSMLKWK
jgi:hypothetical protein